MEYTYENQQQAGTRLENPYDFRGDLLFRDQCLEDLESFSFWRTLVPFLTVSSLPTTIITSSSMPIQQQQQNSRCSNNNNKTNEQQQQQLKRDGFLKVTNGEKKSNSVRNALLLIAVQRLLLHGYHSNFLLMFDETWELIADLAAETGLLNSECKQIGDYFIFTEGCYRIGKPHRDRPLIGLRTNQSDTYLSIWFALSEATVNNSSLCFYPKLHDVDYHRAGEGEMLTQVDVQKIVSMPIKQGEYLLFTHRVIHWATLPRAQLPSEQRRVALTFAVSNPVLMEKATFDTSVHLPFPPLSLRLGLISSSLIQYSHLNESGNNKQDLGLYNRLFMRNKSLFTVEYFEKIRDKFQFDKFMANR